MAHPGWGGKRRPDIGLTLIAMVITAVIIVLLIVVL